MQKSWAMTTSRERLSPAVQTEQRQFWGKMRSWCIRSRWLLTTSNLWTSSIRRGNLIRPKKNMSFEKISSSRIKNTSTSMMTLCRMARWMARALLDETSSRISHLKSYNKFSGARIIIQVNKSQFISQMCRSLASRRVKTGQKMVRWLQWGIKGIVRCHGHFLPQHILREWIT